MKMTSRNEDKYHVRIIIVEISLFYDKTSHTVRVHKIGVKKHYYSQIPAVKEANGC